MFAPEKDALHGMNADDVTIDEAWAFSLEQGEAVEAAVRPAQLTRPWRQTWIVSAGGTIESVYWDQVLQMAERAATVALFDYGADPTDAAYDPASPSVWSQAHPSAGYGFPLAALAHEWDTRRDDASFERAYLNVWPRPSSVVAASGVDLEQWRDAAAPDRPLTRVSAPALDVSADRAWSSVVAAGGAGDGPVTVQVLEHRKGTGWVADVVRELRQTHRGVPVVADSIVAASIVAELARAHVQVEPVSASDHARACSAFVDRLAAGALFHRAQQVLDDAVLGAARRPLGDAWLWSRARSSVDISPLVAATLAAYAAATRRPTGRGAVVTSEPSNGRTRTPTRPASARLRAT